MIELNESQAGWAIARSRYKERLALPLLCQPLLLLLLLPGLSAMAAENVALRGPSGQFICVGGDGKLRAEGFLPGDKATFELVVRGKQEIALKGQGGRYVVPDAKDPRTLRMSPPGAEPGNRAAFQLVPAEANRYSLPPRGSGVATVFSAAYVPADGHAAKPKQAAGPTAAPAAGETVEIFRVRPLPDALQAIVSVTVQGLAAKELAGKQYDQTRTQQTKKYIDVPDPSLKDLKRMKKVQVLAMTEEYRVQAQLDGNAEIRIPTMIYLGNHAEGAPGMILVSLGARLPVTGHVRCKLPDVPAASTGYRATIELAAVVQVGVRRSGSDVAFGPYTVSDLHVSFSRLDLSNNLLEAARGPIKRFINHELERNDDKLRQSANQALEKAMSSRAVRMPLLGYLGLP